MSTAQDFINHIHEAEFSAPKLDKEERVCASDLGLDSRCGKVWVTDEAIIVHFHDKRAIEYYGGFEYVDSSCVCVFSTYVVYSSEDERVQEALDIFQGAVK